MVFIKDIKKLNLFSKPDIKKLKALLFDAVNNTNMLNKTNEVIIVTQTSAIPILLLLPQ